MTSKTIAYISVDDGEDDVLMVKIGLNRWFGNRVHIEEFHDEYYELTVWQNHTVVGFIMTESVVMSKKFPNNLRISRYNKECVLELEEIV